MEQPAVTIDALLEPLLGASDEHVDEFLPRLIAEHAEPVIKGVVRYKLRLNSSQASQRAEADDIYQEVLVQFLSQVQQFRQKPHQHPITDVRGMAAVIAHRTCSRWMRKQFPERHALKNRLHYLLTRQRGLSVWQDEDGRLVAGFAAWQGKRKQTIASQAESLSINKELLGQVRMLKSGKQQELSAALATIFNQVNGPTDFDELVSFVASLIGIRDQPVESLADDDDTASFVPTSKHPDQAWQVEKRMFLQRLWEELQQLPTNQRAALLLNLKDASGHGCITLFPATGVATLKQLAEVLQMPLEDFAELWNELPVEDARIAELLGLTRQQVINARKSGRERLARRLKGFM
jgi:RNA polymerase sigma factor (sigma-70 family)